MVERNSRRRVLLPTVVMLGLLTVLLGACAGQSSFSIVGSWKVVGGSGFGQAQDGAIIQFTDQYANLYSPQDTWALRDENGTRKLDVTGLLGGTTTFTVNVTDNDNIELVHGNATVSLQRVK